MINGNDTKKNNEQNEDNKRNDDQNGRMQIDENSNYEKKF